MLKVVEGYGEIVNIEVDVTNSREGLKSTCLGSHYVVSSEPVKNHGA